MLWGKRKKKYFLTLCSTQGRLFFNERFVFYCWAKASHAISHLSLSKAGTLTKYYTKKIYDFDLAL